MALWAYDPPGRLTFTKGEGETVAFTRGDHELAFHHCRTCGAVTHWQGIVNERRAGNVRLADDPDVLDRLRVHYFDGADSWTTIRIEG